MRLNDYVQFLRVMLIEESKIGGKLVWSEHEVKEKFTVWYGAKPDERYFKEALAILEKEGVARFLDGKISIVASLTNQAS